MQGMGGLFVIVVSMGVGKIGRQGTLPRPLRTSPFLEIKREGKVEVRPYRIASRKGDEPSCFKELASLEK